jgi:hypothetical protein
MGSTFTFSGWFAFDGASAGGLLLCRKALWNDTTGWDLFASGDNGIMMVGGEQNGYNPVTAANFVPSWMSHAWYYVAVAVNGTSVSFYRNGVLQASSTAMTPVVDNDLALTFGYDPHHDSGSWNGRMDEARIQQGAASAGWIWASYMTMASNSVFSSYQIQSGTPGGKTAHGIPYSWLANYGITNTSDSVETQHMSGHSLTVLQDYLAGMNPANPNSCFLVGITNSAGQIIVRMPSVQGTDGKTRYYDVELRTNLMVGSWQPVSGYTSIFGNGSIISCTNAIQNPAAFYRAKVWLQ